MVSFIYEMYDKTESNRWVNKKNKENLTDTDDSMVVTRGKGRREVAKCNGTQIHGDRRRLGFGWGVHNAIYR